MINPWQKLKSLFDDAPKRIGIVQSHNADGSSTVQLVDGGDIKISGQSYPVSQRVFIRGHEAIAEANNLPSVTIDV